MSRYAGILAAAILIVVLGIVTEGHIRHADAATIAVTNPSLETDANADGVPDCWQRQGTGRSKYQLSRTTTAHSGAYGEQLNISRYRSGSQGLLIQMGSSTCGPSVVAGHTYAVSAWYQAWGDVRFTAYYRSAAGSWVLWTTGPRLDSASSWTLGTYTTPQLPSGATEISFGLALRSTGSLTTDDYGLADTTLTSTSTSTSTSASASASASASTSSSAPSTTTSAPAPAPSSSPPASSTTLPASSSSGPSTTTAAPSPTTTASSSSSTVAAPAALSIRVSGNQLVDGNGKPVQLRGANRSGTQYACAEGWGIFDGPSSDASLDAMKAWGINAVRVNGNEDCWLGINGVKAAYSGQNYINALVDYVNRINARGMYVIFDLHHSAPGTQLATGQQPMADRDHSDAYWASVAATFKDNPAVLFDLYNEPYPDSNRDSTAAWTCLRDGGSCPGVPFTAAGSQEMLNAVRSAGARNVVLVGGPQYAGDVDKWTQYAPNDPLYQLAASIHIYYQTPSNPEWAPCDYLSCWNTTMAPLAATTPVVIGEFGEHDCNFDLIDGTALSPPQPDLLDWADQHGISYLAWSWFTGNCAGEPALISSYDGTPTLYGAGVRAHYLQRAG